METLDAIISVRSERQAMDWSLVLASQSIEAFIDQAPETGEWRLLVEPSELDRAQRALRQYEQENRRVRWQQPVRWTGLLFDWRVLFCLLPLVALFVITDVAENGAVKSAGLLDTTAVRQGQWWRLFTAVTLHADAGHLASNLAVGGLLLGLAMGTWGAGKALLACCLAGVSGNLAGAFLLGGSHQGLGSSGAVLGALGLLTVQSFSGWRTGGTHRHLISRGIAAGCLLLVLLGFNPQTDVIAHVGGFLGGCLLGALLLALPEGWTRSTTLDRLAGWACTGMMAFAWWRALT